MIEFIFGAFFGIILLLFIAFVDDRYMVGGGIKLPDSRFKTYLVASCWELLFFTGGMLIGRFLL